MLQALEEQCMHGNILIAFHYYLVIKASWNGNFVNSKASKQNQNDGDVRNGGCAPGEGRDHIILYFISLYFQKVSR